ncbi:hypothetical protein TthHB5008_14200 [Thermus thermophilus]|uniref:DUF4900 domain-containing protein n=1 Tax=Thermus thermophilus TaxID=274 RepID=UPI001951E13B|nr:DUF4900 domain-containing protein [Thermus thermophilus]BCP98319.1 hypothetical protein TthHB5002_14220 [Thermus thermophilus]BCQ00650.1 hypothetical protein TthHB5008_14200 [Thermus thermophilus]
MNRRGIALIAVLVVAAVMTVVGSLLFVGTLGDLRQTRSTLQAAQARAAAEAGLTYARYAMEVARGDIKAILAPKMNLTANPATEWVLPESQWPGIASAIQSLLNGGYGSLPSGAVDQGQASVQFTVTRFRGNTKGATAQTYRADYVVVSTGQVGPARRRTEEKGYFEIQLGRPSLSQWLFLVDDAGGQTGFFPTGTVFNGPVHANHNWGFWGRPVFRDVVSTSDDGAWYWHLSGDGCTGKNRVWVRGDSRPPCTVPDFQKGFLRSQPTIDLPTSTLSQQRAALGMDPQDTSAPSDKEICFALGLHDPPKKNCNKNPSVPDGVYLVNDGANVKGGIYVQGDLDQLVLKATGTGKQIYTFEQGSNTWVITVDYTTNTTTVTKNGAPVGTYAGTPNGPAPLGTGGPTGQIYVTGKIKSLQGPSRTGPLPCGVDYPGSSDNCPDHPPPAQIPPALSKETQLHITAVGAIGLTGDLIYECDPTKVTDPGYLATKPRCALGAGQTLPTVLGVMSQNDDITIKVGAPDNLYLWGSYLSGASGKGLAVENYSSRGRQGKLRLFGGLIQSADQLRGTINASGQLLSGYIETYDYDLRFADSALAPPNFPTVRVFDVQKVQATPLSFREF